MFSLLSTSLNWLFFLYSRSLYGSFLSASSFMTLLLVFSVSLWLCRSLYFSLTIACIFVHMESCLKWKNKKFADLNFSPFHYFRMSMFLLFCIGLLSLPCQGFSIILLLYVCTVEVKDVIFLSLFIHICMIIFGWRRRRSLSLSLSLNKCMKNSPSLCLPFSFSRLPYLLYVFMHKGEPNDIS